MQGKALLFFSGCCPDCPQNTSKIFSFVFFVTYSCQISLSTSELLPLFLPVFTVSALLSLFFHQTVLVSGPAVIRPSLCFVRWKSPPLNLSADPCI
ncbi:hypothetical protein KFK09_027778 [Dendrobium nobile]|uniref:Uncharacterized protein n=1 Tax=Dendrobium nobile TaxID=94219 RepID=A0A8T3A085_DENNO|nr:hypothetical protein KFK09_027778 [Dendrobium nobile]